MKRLLVLLLMFASTLPAFASTHNVQYKIPCSQLWNAVKDTLRNSGKYGILSISDSEMVASYNIGGNLTGKRTNSAVLNSTNNGAGCQMQIQTAYSGLINNDVGDFKSRVDDSLTRLKDAPVPTPAPAATPQAAAPAVAEQAAVSVESTPTGADIEIDGAFVGNTPSKITLTPGSHTVVVKK